MAKPQCDIQSFVVAANQKNGWKLNSNKECVYKTPLC
jgi:hypothetical protein